MVWPFEYTADRGLRRLPNGVGATPSSKRNLLRAEVVRTRVANCTLAGVLIDGSGSLTKALRTGGAMTAAN